MDAVHAYVVAAYTASLIMAVLATIQMFHVSRKVVSPRLRRFWLAIIVVSGAVEFLHGWTVFYLAFKRDNSAFASSATILLAAGALFVGMATLIRLSVEDALQVPDLKRLAFLDILTDLGNRRAFEQALRSAMERPPMGIVLIDIDHFKTFNDEYGHDVGDLVLRHVADTLGRASRGHAVYRIGGEEFGLLTGGDARDTASLAESCRSAVEQASLVHAGTSFSATISLGMAVSHPDETIASLRQRADKALYDAKRSGRNRTVVQTLTTEGSEDSGSLRQPPGRTGVSPPTGDTRPPGTEA